MRFVKLVDKYIILRCEALQRADIGAFTIGLSKAFCGCFACKFSTFALRLGRKKSKGRDALAGDHVLLAFHISLYASMIALPMWKNNG